MSLDECRAVLRGIEETVKYLYLSQRSKNYSTSDDNTFTLKKNEIKKLMTNSIYKDMILDGYIECELSRKNESGEDVFSNTDLMILNLLITRIGLGKNVFIAKSKLDPSLLEINSNEEFIFKIENLQVEYEICQNISNWSKEMSNLFSKYIIQFTKKIQYDTCQAIRKIQNNDNLKTLQTTPFP